MILRTPRLFLTSDDPRDIELGVKGLVSLLAQWEISCTLYCVAPNRLREALELGDSPPVRAIDDILAVPLHEPEFPRMFANGGDLTLLLDAYPSSEPRQPVLEIASITRSPVVRFVRSLGEATSELALESPEPVDGHLVIDPEGDGLHRFVGAADSPPRLPGDSFGLGDLLILGYRAPLLIGQGTPSRTDPLPRTVSPRASRRQSKGALMIGGTGSSVGKSLLTIGMCRHFAAKGLRVAPFKGQNMSNNARVVDGGEIGVAQYLQALAARTTPDVRMNPVLIKPQEGGSDLIVGGRAAPQLAQLPWRLRKPPTWPVVRDSLRSLCEEFDLVVIEGAGSIAEVGMYGNDIVNMRVAREAEAAVLLVTNAAKGGSIADCLGTWFLLPPGDRELIAGYIFNRFYRGGNPELMRTGLQQLEQMTSLPVLGIVPDFIHDLPEEDRYSLSIPENISAGARVAIVQYPYMSNFDEFAPLIAMPEVSVVWADDPRDLQQADIVILPGSKHVAADLNWIRDRNMDSAVRSHAQAGKRLLGICGGLQMLGGPIEDPDGVEGSAHGLGLLDLATEFKAEKIQQPVRITFNTLPAAWDDLTGLPVQGYEIRHGRSLAGPGTARALPEGSGFVSGSVLGVYVHGLFENANVTSSLFGSERVHDATIERTFDSVAGVLAESIDMAAVERLALQ